MLMIGSCTARVVTLLYSVLPATIKLPVMVVVPPTLSVPAVAMLPPVIVPLAVSAAVDLLNVKPLLALAMLLSLKIICVLAPGEAILPLMLPTTLPIKYGATTLPAACTSPPVLMLPPVTLPTIDSVARAPTCVMLV